MEWTSLAAAWGAVAGTTGILLQLRSYLRDRPKLGVSIRLHYIDSLSPIFELLVFNQGRRPIWLDSLVFVIRASSLNLGKVIVSWRDEYRHPSTQQELKEGGGVSFDLASTLPVCLRPITRITGVHRIGVRDKTGNIWWSKSRVCERALLDRGDYAIVRQHIGDNHLLELSKGQKRYALHETSNREGCKTFTYFHTKWRAMKAFDQAREQILRGYDTKGEAKASTGPTVWQERLELLFIDGRARDSRMPNMIGRADG